jgi:Tol biopolymer transport system component
MPDGKSILYVAYKDTAESDILKYDLTTKKISQITQTSESEYSPNLTPDSKSISVVRVDIDDGQRFYTFPLDGYGHPHYFKGTDSIGYYCWLNDSGLAMFILRDVMSLQILNTNTSERKWIVSDIGRCMKLSPDKKSMYFVLKQNADEWSIFKLDISTLVMHKVITTLKGSEDFAIMPDGSLLMGSEGKLFRYRVGEKQWQQVADFISALGNFYRITVNTKGDKIALVAFTGEKP